MMGQVKVGENLLILDDTWTDMEIAEACLIAGINAKANAQLLVIPRTSHADMRGLSSVTASAIQGADLVVALCEKDMRNGLQDEHVLGAIKFGLSDRLGTVEVGKLADLIVLAGDPLEDISNIRKLKMVLKGGQLVNTEEPEGLADLWELLFF